MYVVKRIAVGNVSGSEHSIFARGKPTVVLLGPDV
jgi:hypothetical protein